MRRVLALLVLIVELALVAENTSAEQASGAQNKVAEFNLKLNVKGFQVGELHIGCKSGATAAYDKGQDIYVPPAAIHGGIIGLFLENNPLPLYQDIRPAALPQTWRIQCRTQGRASIAWEKDLLPAGVTFTIRKDKGPPLDMRKTDSMTIIKDTELFITASKESVKIEE